ncbi:MAG: tripartite tricarboxylate transporter substrate binding protein [Betaproteobacteria bacterium]|jgi:tripartite-type tricarboxylate transporter receptor subunit TctC
MKVVKLISQIISILCLFLNFPNSMAAFPERPISMVVSFAPGGATDITARIVSTAMTKNMGQQIVVDNRPGVGGAVAAGVVKSAKANGYTLMLTSSVYVVTPSLKKPSPYDPVKDFIPVCEIGDAPNVIVVKADSKINTLSDLIALARKDAAGVSYGSPGTGTTPHLAGEVLQIRENIKMTHIPYKGAGPAMTDLLGGHTQVLFSSLASVISNIQAGQVRAIAQTGEKKWPDLQQVPTLAELGIQNAVSDTFQAIFVVAGTPPEIVSQLTKQCLAALKQPEVIESLKQAGLATTAVDSEGLHKRILREVPYWKEVIDKGGIKAE